jgi:hypothetical protein
MLSITQRIWRTATQELTQAWPSDHQNQKNAWMDGIILLPPTDIMCLIREIYSQQDNTQFPFLHDRKHPLPNPIMDTENQLLCGLSTLLIIARITQSSLTVQARDLSNGLISLCLSFLDQMEWGTSIAQSCISLTLMQLLQWSGEAHQMIVSHLPAV